ncbi:MAG: hypothetical protein EOO10_00035 [Chitinophagaceae bacterium]|nr:MAG: hypothetical protein EOO10_00035 [Chitinophagaceae bacterium]
MKPLLSICFFFFSLSCFSQSLDYISVRKKNGIVIKNFYAGSNIVVQTTSGSYLQGPIQTIKNDSVFITLYDIRYFPTVYGTYFRDTIAITIVSLRKDEIQRILIQKRRNFLQRTVAPIAIIGGAGYFTLNLLNGTFFDNDVSGNRKLKVLGVSAGTFGIGYLIQKLFSSDGFSKKSHQIVYVDL